MDTQDTREIIKDKLRQNFAGKIVRKDLTKKIKEGANVPVYVLEFLLGQYCSSDDPELIEKGVESVKHILADNFVRPDEAQKILSQLRQRGNYTVIDRITVKLDIKKDAYFAEFSNLGLRDVPIEEDYPAKFDRLLCGGIWCIIQLHISLFLVKLCHTTLCRQFYSFTPEITNCFFRTLQHLFTILLPSKFFTNRNPANHIAISFNREKESASSYWNIVLEKQHMFRQMICLIKFILKSLLFHEY